MEPCTPPHQGFGCFAPSVTVAEPCRRALRWATSGWHESPGKAPPALSSCRVGSRHSGVCSRPQAPGEHQGESLRMPAPRGLGLHLAQWDTPPRNRPAAPGINLVGNSDAQLCAFVSRRAGPRNRAFLCGVSRARPSASGASPFASGARCRASRPAGLAGQFSVSHRSRGRSRRSTTQVSSSSRQDRRSATRGPCSTAAVATRRRHPCRRRRLVRGQSARTDLDVRPDTPDVRRVVRPRCDAGPPSRRAEDRPQRGPGRSPADRSGDRVGTDRNAVRDGPGTDRAGDRGHIGGPSWGRRGDGVGTIPTRSHAHRAGPRSVSVNAVNQ